MLALAVTRESGFDDLGAGDEVVEAAAVVAEDQAPVGDVKGGAEEERTDDRKEAEDYAAERDERFAEEPGVEEAGFGAVDAGDADLRDDFADGLSAGAEKENLDDEKEEPTGEDDEDAEAEAHHVELLGVGFDAAHAGLDDFNEFGSEDEKARNAAENFDDPVDEAGEKAGAALGEICGRGGRGKERGRDGEGAAGDEGRGGGTFGVELGKVAQGAPLVGAGEFGAGLEVGAAGGDPGTDLFDAGGAVFFSVAAEDGEHDGNEAKGGRGVNWRGG